MKLYIFGTASGTEPIAGRDHTALALDVDGRIYWFDAGENCSRTAHLMGVDLLKVSDIFISHPHIDHVGGLANLLWNIRKISHRSKRNPVHGDVNIYISNLTTYEGILSILKNSEGHYKTDYKTVANKIADGTLLKNDDIEVVANHNTHIPPEDEGWQSFSFCITVKGKKIIYSGDVKSFDELSGFLEGGCDILLMETGHHKAEEICRRIAEENIPVKSLMFMHHGREIINDPEGVLGRCREIFNNTVFCKDGDIFDI